MVQKNKDAQPEKAYFIMQKGNNTAIITTQERSVLAHADQIRNRYEEDMIMEESERNEDRNQYDGDVMEPIDESESDSDVPYQGSSSDEMRPRSPLRRTPRGYLGEAIGRRGE